MRIACVNSDRGIQPARKKGAAVHLREMRRSFEALGAKVLAVDSPADAAIRDQLEGWWSSAPIDLVYERFALGSAVAAEFARDHKLPHVIEINTPLVEEQERWRGPVTDEVRRKERRVLGGADLVVAVSSDVARYAVERGAAPERVHVQPNGVDTERFRPRDPSDPLRAQLVPAGRFALGFHGRLRGWHGFERLVRASQQLIEEGLPIHLVLVGEGDFETVLSGRVPEGRFTRVAWIDHREIPRYVATFDALPLTYDPDAPCYFSPLKLAEAMACGVVPVVPAMGDLTRIVRHEENGLVFARDRMDELLKSLRRLVEEAELRDRLGAGARKTAEGMSWKQIASFILHETLRLDEILRIGERS